MDATPALESSDRKARLRFKLLALALALLVIAPLSLWPGARYGGAAKLLRIANGGPLTPEDDREAVIEVATIYYDWQYTVLVLVLGLTLLATLPLYPIL